MAQILKFRIEPTIMLEILLKLHKEKLIPPEKILIGDWIDLRAAETVVVPPRNQILISLGISIKLPEGYEAHLVPRSSLFKAHSLIQTNHIGIFDNSFCGDNDIWKFSVYNVSDNPEMIEFNQRICQFRIVKQQPALKFTVVDSLNLENPDYSRGEFGSTGNM